MAIRLVLLAATLCAALADHPSPSVLRVTPDPGTAARADTIDLYVAFDRPIMSGTSGSFSLLQKFENGASIRTVFNASVHSPSVWIGPGYHSTHFGATANLVLPADTLTPNQSYCVTLTPGAFVSSPDAVPAPAIGEGDWCFHATIDGAPRYDSVIPSSPSAELRPLIAGLVGRLHEATVAFTATIQHLATYYNRFFASETGYQSHQWLAQEYTDIARTHPDAEVWIKSFPHKWKMPSLIVRLGPEQPDQEVVILGAHLDTINRQNWTQNLDTGRAPGANDDGTGIAVQLEIFKTLLSSNNTISKLKNDKQQRVIEIHAYSGEEEGLYGSADVAAEYQRLGTKVAGMLMLDQCGYVRDPEHPVIGVYTDNTDVTVTSLLTRLIEMYSRTPAVVSNEDHRADSDFHSFHNNGYRVGYIAEGPVDDIVYGNNKHTAFDMPSGVNVSHAMEIGGVALAFLLEMTLHI